MIGEDPTRALYVHVPFCQAKCRYCDFYSQCLDPALAARYVQAVAKEMAMHRRVLAGELDTIFIGGGTPTVLGPNLLGELLSVVAPLAGADAEFSVEANPGTLDDRILETAVRHGVNRVNLGVQSFQDDELAVLGRIHDSATAVRAVLALRQAGLRNVGLDLIYGLPGQDMKSWQASLRQAIDLGIDHLSCYALSFEPGTPLWQVLQAGAIREMDESLQKDCYYAAIAAAEAAGLRHYEISNFAAEGRRCRHNLTYWHNESYLGLGPAAASYIGGMRRVNQPSTAAYLSSLERNEIPPCEQEHLEGRRLMAETAMLGLRLTAGLDRDEFAARFSQDVTDAFPQSIKRYHQAGALELTPRSLRIPKQYLFVADTILADMIEEGK